MGAVASRTHQRAGVTDPNEPSDTDGMPRRRTIYYIGCFIFAFSPLLWPSGNPDFYLITVPLAAIAAIAVPG